MPTSRKPDPPFGHWVRLPIDTTASAPAEFVPLLVGYTIETVERELILSTLAYANGNRTYAAELLGISIRTLRNRLRDYRSAGAAIPGTARPAH